MESFGPDIWIMNGDRVRMYGLLPFTTRMTIIRLQADGLWLHSPVRPTEERRDSVDALGPVTHLIAPNLIHSLGIAPWQKHYPQAQTWVSPGFPARHPDITADGVLSNGISAPWSTEIDHHVLEGHRVLDEVAFLHRASKTLVLTDFIQKHVTSGEHAPWTWIKRLAGVLGRDGGVPMDVRLSVRDKAELRRSVETILAWDFDNLIIAHGHCLKGRAKDHVRDRFRWLLRD